MKAAHRCTVIMFAVMAAMLPGAAQQTPVLVQGSLIAPGSEPFHLIATITEDHDASPKATIEMFWLAPDIWRRTIESQEFSQTVIVNRDRKLDKHSDDYFPTGLDTLATAMIDPRPLLRAYATGDHILTKANGQSNESGVTCFDPRHAMCLSSPFGLMESIGMGTHYIDFSSYEEFKGKRIARRLVYNISVGDFLTARVVELEPLINPAESLFAIDQPTPGDAQLQTAIYSESELRSLIIGKGEVIWPQVLDGGVTGNASFYLGIDPGGRVREVLPISTTNERSNDSAIRQIMRWRFRPATKDGVPVQAEGLITLALNTRAFGPANVLSDGEVRKLAKNIVEPEVPPGKVPPGTEYKLWIAVDSDGIVIEHIHEDGPSDLTGVCGQALGQWRFSPIMEGGQPRPYRGEVIFRF